VSIWENLKPPFTAPGVCFIDGRPATGRGEHPHLCWSHTPNEDDAYPVLVTYTSEHVVWVTAPSAEAALGYVQQEAYEYTDDKSTLADAYWSAELPKDKYQFEDVYRASSCNYAGLSYDGHVELRRAWFNRIEFDRLDAWIVNEDRYNVYPAKRQTCAACKRWREDGHDETRHHQVMQRYADEDRARAAAKDSGAVTA
jgi:hypothetical protein